MMTDRKAIELYRKIEPLETKDKSILKQTAKEVRECVEAKSLEDGVKALQKYQWGDPMQCALILRGCSKCPTCYGTGYIQ